MEKAKRELIGSGARADVYRQGPYALKAFHPGTSPALIMREAYIGQAVHEAGLPVPKAYGMAEEEGLVIRMEYVPGKNLHEAILAEPARCKELIGKMVGLQRQIHTSAVSLPFTLEESLRGRIQGGPLPDGDKRRALRHLDSLPKGNALCHGDFHGGNVLTDGVRFTVIDWANAGMGHPDADALRTWMIYALHLPELAGLYLEAYCQNTRRPVEELLRWLPVLAAARLGEGFGEEREALLGWIKEGL